MLEVYAWFYFNFKVLVGGHTILQIILIVFIHVLDELFTNLLSFLVQSTFEV